MKKYNIWNKVKLAKSCVNQSKSKVKVEREYIDTFEIYTGVRQGDGFLPLIFNIAVEEALRKNY